jgi:zinc protease
MKRILYSIFIGLIYFSTISAQDIPKFSPDDIDIPYEKFELDNGLTLIVHEDHKAPIVAVNVWYHVGSKNEKVGKSGFAHLFEHLMFNGSENYNDDYFQALERIGGTDLNGTTNNDRTNYFQNVPTSALDQVLFLESDRMGHLLGAIDQDKLDEQRGVVQNEKRQGENQPYGKQYDLITKEMFPKGHPYSWTVIGEMEDLNAASLEDVHEWFKSYYGAANAVISIAGDIDTKEIHEKVKKYFGHIPAGPTIVRPEVNIPLRTGETRQSYEDRVPENRIVQVWNTPQWGGKEDAYLDLISSILSSGKNSRLYKKLVYEDQSCSNVSAFQWSKEIASNFVIQANVKPGYNKDEVEPVINDIVWEFLKNGPTEEEVARVKAQYCTNFIKGIERIGGFGGKSDILAMNAVYAGDPGNYKKTLKTIADATTSDIHKTAKKWLSDGKHVLICNPFPEYTNTETDVDRSSLPELGTPPVSHFPNLEKAELSNGMKIVLARRQDVPTVIVNTLFDAGYASDINSTAGTASLAMNMLDEGTKTMNSLEINEKLQVLGASISSYSDLDHSFVNMNTLKPSLDASLDIYAEVLMNPAFPENEFKRLQQEQLAGIQREKATPVQMAIRVFPKYIYEEGHPYSLPLTGSGFEKTVNELSIEDMKKFYSTWIVPNNATMVVVGDISMDELKMKLEQRLGDWKKGKAPKKEIAEIKTKKGNVLYLMDRPESLQSIIIGGHLVDPYGKISEIGRETLMNVFGGEFTSRLNMNLREDKHWAYGAFGLILNAKGQRPLITFAPVQTDKTKESIEEMIKEFKMISLDHPVTQEEFDKTTVNRILQLPGQWETNGSVAGSVNQVVKYGLKDDYYQHYGEMVRALKVDDVRNLAKDMIHPGRIQWFVVGDKEKILPGLKELDLDEIVLVNPDGEPIEKIKVSMSKT